jgi:hypothetical protein
MSETCISSTCESGEVAPSGSADWLYLAAAPTFAIMALLTAFLATVRRTSFARLRMRR